MRPSQWQFGARISANASAGHSIWLWTAPEPLALPLTLPLALPLAGQSGHDFWLDFVFGLSLRPLCVCLKVTCFYSWPCSAPSAASSSSPSSSSSPVCVCVFLVFSFSFSVWNYYLWVRIVVAVLKVIWIASIDLGTDRTHTHTHRHTHGYLLFIFWYLRQFALLNNKISSERVAFVFLLSVETENS